MKNSSPEFMNMQKNPCDILKSPSFKKEKTVKEGTGIFLCN
jgi:hypothetical protein